MYVRHDSPRVNRATTYTRMSGTCCWCSAHLNAAHIALREEHHIYFSLQTSNTLHTFSMMRAICLQREWKQKWQNALAGVLLETPTKMRCMFMVWCSSRLQVSYMQVIWGAWMCVTHFIGGHSRCDRDSDRSLNRWMDLVKEVDMFKLCIPDPPPPRLYSIKSIINMWNIWKWLRELWILCQTIRNNHKTNWLWINLGTYRSRAILFNLIDRFRLIGLCSGHHEWNINNNLI